MQVIVIAVVFALFGSGCANRSLKPDAMRGKTYAVYPTSIPLTLKGKPGAKDVIKLSAGAAVYVLTAAATDFPALGSVQKSSIKNFGPPLIREFAIKFEQEFGMHKIADSIPHELQVLPKPAGGEDYLWEDEVKTNYQNVADYLVHFINTSNSLAGSFRLNFESMLSDNFNIRYLVKANIYNAKTGKLIDWAMCSGKNGSATLDDWFKDEAKMLELKTQEIASKCADEMIRKPK